MEPARFLTPLRIEKIGTRLWRLTDDFIFESILYPGQFIAPKGVITNFASIPRVLWVWYPPVDDYDAAAVIHDSAYHNELLTIEGRRIFTVKEVADRLFHEALLACKVNKVRAWAMYQAVKAYGVPNGPL